LLVDQTAEDGYALEQRATLLPSQRTNVRAGSLVVRDMRMWHRGVPNQSPHVRTMLALVYTRGWLRPSKPVQIPPDVWNAWPAAARGIFRHNQVVDRVENVGVPQS